MPTHSSKNQEGMGAAAAAGRARNQRRDRRALAQAREVLPVVVCAGCGSVPGWVTGLGVPGGPKQAETPTSASAGFEMSNAAHDFLLDCSVALAPAIYT